MTVGFLKRLLGPLIIGLAVVLSLLYFINAGNENLKKSGCDIGLVFIRVFNSFRCSKCP